MLIEGVAFNCRFYHETWVVVGNVYTCATNSISRGSEHIWRLGTHLAGKVDIDVRFLVTYNQNLDFVPKKIDSFFPNLQVSCEFFSLSADDLKQFPNLIVFDVEGNKLVSVESDVFKSTP